MSLNVDYNLRPDYDEVIQDIANYVNANSAIKNRMVSKHEDYFKLKMN